MSEKAWGRERTRRGDWPQGTGTPLLSYLGMLDFSAPVSASETQDKTSQREWIQWAYPKPGAEPALINGAVIPVNKTRACPQACHNPDTQIITIQ